MLTKYKMPNGRTYQFAEGDVPAGAVPVAVKAAPEVKAVKKPSNKAVKPQNKTRKAVEK